MKELLIRTLSGIVLVAVLLACILFSPWACAALGLLVVVAGTLEMGRLQQVARPWHLVMGVLLAVATYALAALVGLEVFPAYVLILEGVIVPLPFLLALFSTTVDFRRIAAFCFGSMVYLSMPCAMMLFLYRPDLFGAQAGPWLILLIFALLWVNDIFAYLTGRLLGKHKLFERISPGKTVEGSLGGLVFTLAGVLLVSHFTGWIPMTEALCLGGIAVVFGTLGDLCESMLKRQAGVKDSGKLIPGHGGVLDRFDSVLFAIPFVFVYLLLV